MKLLLLTLLAPLTIIRERVVNRIEQVVEFIDNGLELAGDLLANRTGFFGEFILSESGRVSTKRGFPVAWTGGLLVAAAVLLPAPTEAACHEHGGYCTAQWHCALWCMMKNCNQSFYCDTEKDANVCDCYEY